MKFTVGNKVKEIRPPYQIGTVQEAEADIESSTGEFYLVDFGVDSKGKDLGNM